MIKKRDNDSVATAVVIPQTSDHSINPNPTPNEATLDTPVISLIVDKEEIDLHGANPPYHTGGELDAKPDNTRMLATPHPRRHYFSEGRKEKEVDLCGDSIPHCTRCQSREASAVSKDKEEVKSEEVDDSYYAIPLRQVDSEAKPEQDGCGASAASSTSSNGSDMHLTPATSSADDDEPNDIEESLKGLPIDNLPPRINHNSPYIQRNTRTPSSHLVKPQSPNHANAPSTPRQAHRPPPATCASPPGTPKHEIFLYSLPSRNASVPEVRLWIASWFLRRDISFGIPWHGTDFRMREYVECVSWSGGDVHGAGSRSLELDLRGWMLGGYARPIVRDIERAREMERARRWKVLWGRLVDFLWGGWFCFWFCPVRMGGLGFISCFLGCWRSWLGPGAFSLGGH